MQINDNLLKEIVNNSLKKFFEYDLELIQRDVSERAWCGRLAIYMEKEIRSRGNIFVGYFVDVEYNRGRGGAKIMTRFDKNGKFISTDSITCDLILHSRGKIIENDNLIAVEMKKESGRGKKEDKQRLRILTTPKADLYAWSDDNNAYEYDLGVYIEIDVRKMSCLIQMYKEGKKISNSELTLSHLTNQI
jgi:hypothetical protein